MAGIASLFCLCQVSFWLSSFLKSYKAKTRKLSELSKTERQRLTKAYARAVNQRLPNLKILSLEAFLTLALDELI
tara:strand:+ start:219 stop:443 length:225 start_codon:yes stop_codon:yes gene_type:complete